MTMAICRYGTTVATMAVIVAHASLASALTVNVNTTANDTNPGHCSLNEAMNLFYGQTPIGTCTWVADGSNSYTIQLIAGTFTNFYIYISGYTLNGAGQTKTTILTNNNYQEGLYFDSLYTSGAASNLTVKGQNQSSSTPVAGVHNEITATLTNVTISGYTGAGVYNLGTLTINSSTIENNSSVAQSDAGGLGGGICNYGVVTLNNSTVTQNSASQGAGVYTANTYGYGGVVTSNSSTFSSNNASQAGGGITNSGATLTLTKSTVSQNTAGSGGGGGIDNQSVSGGTASLDIENSTISGNSTPGVGGGLLDTSLSIPTVNNSTFNGNKAASGGGIYEAGEYLEMTYSTIANNAAQNGAGGGVYIGPNSNGSMVSWGGWHITVAFNTATSSSNKCGAGAGVYAATNTSVDWNGSLIAGNTTNNNADDYVGVIHTLSEFSDGANPDIIVAPHSGKNCYPGGWDSYQAYDPMNNTYTTLKDFSSTVGALFGSNGLGANGGPTSTILLASSSPAVNACQTPSGMNNLSGSNNTADQRGDKAPLGGQYDLGSVELK